MRKLPLTAALLTASTAVAAVMNTASALPSAYATSLVSNFSVGANTGSFAIDGTANNNGTSTNSAGEEGYAPTSFIDSRPNGTVANATQGTSGPGPFPAADTYSQVGASTNMNGVRADGWVNLFATAGGMTSGGQTVAEGRLTSGSAGSSTGKFDAAFRLVVTDGTMLVFNFNDVVGLNASTSVAGEDSNASVSTTLQITNSNGATVFSFAPDGSGFGRIVGGTTFANPYNLNQTVGSVGGFPATASAGNSADNSLFTALTDPLGAGTYLVDVRTTSQENVLTGQPASVPEPMSLVLLGTGLVAAGVARRRA